MYIKHFIYLSPHHADGLPEVYFHQLYYLYTESFLFFSFGKGRGQNCKKKRNALCEQHLIFKVICLYKNYGWLGPNTPLWAQPCLHLLIINNHTSVSIFTFKILLISFQLYISAKARLRILSQYTRPYRMQWHLATHPASAWPPPGIPAFSQ